MNNITSEHRVVIDKIKNETKKKKIEEEAKVYAELEFMWEEDGAIEKNFPQLHEWANEHNGGITKYLEQYKFCKQYHKDMVPSIKIQIVMTVEEYLENKQKLYAEQQNRNKIKQDRSRYVASNAILMISATIVGLWVLSRFLGC